MRYIQKGERANMYSNAQKNNQQNTKQSTKTEEQSKNYDSSELRQSIARQMKDIDSGIRDIDTNSRESQNS